MEKQNSISSMLYRISIMQRAILEKQLKKMDINLDQGRALNLILAKPEIKQVEIADYLGRSSASASNMLKGLEKSGLIIRKISENSEREKHLVLTDAGEAVVRKIDSAFSVLNQRIDDLVSDDVMLKSQLNRLIDGLQEE